MSKNPLRVPARTVGEHDSWSGIRQPAYDGGPALSFADVRLGVREGNKAVRRLLSVAALAYTAGVALTVYASTARHNRYETIRREQEQRRTLVATIVNAPERSVVSVRAQKEGTQSTQSTQAVQGAQPLYSTLPTYPSITAAPAGPSPLEEAAQEAGLFLYFAGALGAGYVLARKQAIRNRANLSYILRMNAFQPAQPTLYVGQDKPWQPEAKPDLPGDEWKQK